MGLVVLYFLGLTVVFFGPVFRGDTFSTVPGHQTAVYPWASFPHKLTDSYPQSDQADLNFPWQTFLTDSLRKGAFPFWEPHSYGGGYPFFTNGSSSLLYPPRLVSALILDAGWAHDLFSMLHVFLAGLVMFALAREFELSCPGALLAGTAWMFSGFNMAWLHLEVVAPMAVFLPLVLLCVHRAYRLRSPTSTFVAAVVLGAALVSGHLILLGLVYLVGISYAAALTLRDLNARRRTGLRRLGIGDLSRLTSIGITSIALPAVVLIPTGILLSNSQRDPFSYDELTRSFLAPAQTFLHSFWPPPLPITEGHMHEMTFVGTLTAVLAVVGLVQRKRSGVGLGRALLTVSFAVAIGTPATWLAYHFIPGFKVFRPYSRLVVFWSFALALLGGVGLDALFAQLRRLGRWHTNVSPRAVIVTVSAVVIGTTTGQLMWYGREINPPFVKRSRASAFPPTPLIRALQTEVRRPERWPGSILPVRVVGSDNAQPPPMLFAGEPLVFGLDSTGGYDSAVPRRVTALIRILQGEDPEAVLRTGLPSAYAPTFLSPRTRFDLAARIGVTTIVATPGPAASHHHWLPVRAPQTKSVYEGLDGQVLRLVEETAGPKIVYANELVTGDQAALRRFIDPAFDFQRSVVLEASELRRARLEPLAAPGTGEVESSRRGVNTATVRVRTTAPAWLVLPTSWAPGWSAKLNGSPVSVIRANYAKQAVRIPAGTSVIKLRYRPPGLLAGVAVSSASLVGWATIPVLTLVRRRRGADRCRGQLSRRVQI